MADSPPLARRMPGFEGRHATRRARRTRGLAALVIVLILIAALALYFGHGAGKKNPTPAVRHPGRAAPSVRVTSTLATWRLGAPISRAVVLPDAAAGGDQLIILGGVTTGGLTAQGAFALDVATGTLTQVGDLMTTLDGASGAVIDGQDAVFGGTESASSAASSSVQALPQATSASVSSPSTVTATALGTLPQARANATAVTAVTALAAGSTTYLVGGTNSAGPVSDIVSTTDGRHFSVVATLLVPVQFPAVAVVGNDLDVFGGTGAAGANAGRPLSTIQVVDLKTHKVTDNRSLPEPLTGAAAVVLGSHVLLAGGDTATAPSGTTAKGSSGTTTTTTAAGGTASASSVSTVWSFDPSSGTCAAVGQLSVAVSHAGVAVIGSTAWLVGGESGGTPVSSVQSFVATPSSS